ncbi:GNAT family N-acetyltransferase [Fusobacterium sp.]|uniref:GNAT family N-acetyltransferase n=1 Tax=Fusobacterium sp. TaxID=68766 RepID=UPI00396CDEBE
MGKVIILKLETSRLMLRPWKKSDAESLYKYAKNEKIGPAAGWLPHRSIEESEIVIRDIFSVPNTFAMILKDTGEPVGSIGLMVGKYGSLDLPEKEAELGYWLGVPYWGQGLMPEAAHELLRFGFEELGLEKIWCCCSSENKNSQRVQEKCGFKFVKSVNTEYELLHKKIIREIRVLEKSKK